MQQKSIKWNAILNVIRMSLSILFPLITFPYASRVLGTETLGMVNYTLTFVNYAALIAALGISNYASREGAKIRENKEQIGNFTRQIFTLNLVTTIIAYIVLFVFITLISNLHVYWKLIFIQSLSIIFTTLSVEWINVIYEDYLYITVRAIVTNIITVILLFLLVKNPADYYIYAGLTVISHAVISIANYFHCKKYVRLGLTKNINVKKHITPVMVFFANSLAVSIYVNSDTTMLGWLVGNHNVGLYTAAGKVYSMVKTVLAAMYGVTISRMTYYLSSGNTSNYFNLCKKVVGGLITVLLPGVIALILFAKDVILILSGINYVEATLTLQILSVGLIFAIFGGFITTCINIPNGREKNNMVAAFISAGINIILNLFMIPRHFQNGAAITTVLAEFIVFFICLIGARDLIKDVLSKELKRSLRDGIVGIAIVVISYIITKGLTNLTIVHLVSNVVFCIVGYGIYLIITGNSIVSSYMMSISNKIKRRK